MFDILSNNYHLWSLAFFQILFYFFTLERIYHLWWTFFDLTQTKHFPAAVENFNENGFKFLLIRLLKKIIIIIKKRSNRTTPTKKWNFEPKCC